MTDGCKVQLNFVPEAAALIRFVAHLSRRPMDSLMSGFLQDEARSCKSDMDSAAGGEAYYIKELNTRARDVIKHESEAQKGVLEKDEQGLGPWEWLQLESYREDWIRKFKRGKGANR